ncbi:Sec23/Sec24 trunk domain-containing protein [Gorgonomyces haynaldii]|nr:Sec23/Sec24 trunk domain-containing protein [Gorgonomyces haynaldii]
MQPGLQPNAPKPRIDPDQIPSPIAVHDNDQNLFNSNIFMTMSKDMPPLSNTRYRAVDEGNCNPRFMRSTLYNIPTSDDVAKLSSIPLGLIVQPLADLDPQEAPLSVVDFGKPGPCRCSRCNAYVNPFFRFLDGGRRFMCNICQHTNEVSADYFSNLDMNGRRVDINERPELKFGSCEFAVYDQYCARPAVPLSYLFVIDVSWNAIQTGMLATFASSIKHYLYSGAFRWPEGALVGFITFDKSLHFYNLNPALEQFQMMVVADMEDVFAPMQHGLCVDPLKARSNIEQFLDALPTMFSNSRVTEAALGSAMQAAFDALKPTGGRVSFFQTSLPTFGLGVLKNREDVKILGTDKEKALYEPQEYFWKKLGQDCASHGIGVDSYLFASSYTDVATVGVLSALTGGETNMYGSFDANRHGVKFANDLHRTLSRTYGYDGLLRVRVSTGLKVAEYFGNIFMKNATDVEVAGMDSLKAIGVGLQYDGKLDERADVYVQAAFLYTTAEGQRRVRVHNLSLGIASQQANIFRKAEMDTVIGFLTRATIQEAFTTPLKTLRERLTQRCVKILTAYRQHCAASSSPGQLILPESLKLLPLYTLAVLKSRALRGGKMVPSDQRVYTMRLLNSLGIAEHANYLYPRFYNISIHDPTVGVMNEHGLLQLPPLLRCSAARLSPSGIYLAENGRHLFLWIGAAASQDLIRDLFGVEQLGQIDSRSNHLPTRDNEYSKQVSIVIEYLRSIRYRFMQLNIVRQGMDPQNEQRFGQLLIEDSNLDNQSYVDYLCDIHRSIQKGMSK